MKTTILFNIFTVSTLLASIFTITSKNPVISVLFLIATFVLSACYLMFSGVNFIGISYIIIYVGAIAILFLFIIMMINVRINEIIETKSQFKKNLPLGFLLVFLFFYLFLSFIPKTYSVQYLPSIYIYDNLETLRNSYSIETLTNNLLQIDNIGFSLYVYGAIFLIICSVILLLAMFSAIILSSNNTIKK